MLIVELIIGQYNNLLRIPIWENYLLSEMSTQVEQWPLNLIWKANLMDLLFIVDANFASALLQCPEVLYGFSFCHYCINPMWFLFEWYMFFVLYLAFEL